MGAMASMRQLADWGFKRWYERQLIEAHAWLVSAFLFMILAISGLEIAGDAVRWGKVGGALLAFMGAIVGWLSYRRYKAMLDLAERLGEDATCPTCGRYAKFEIEQATPDGDSPEKGEVHVAARCRHCDARWMLPH
jgi:hypothetical protein